MESPLALYRRYRPETFAEVIGQEHVTEPLRHALAGNRVNHAYLFSGPRGCGKTTSARILARSLNCEQAPVADPCGECRSCQDLARGGPGSIDVIEIDAASHGGVDDARDLREKAFFAPVHSKYKVYIIDEAHMVTTQGFNALLKLVEEPPPHLRFIFATTEPDKVLPTIRSRTHHYPFRLIPPRLLSAYLGELCAKEGVTIEPAAVPLVVRAGAGSARDTLSVLDQLMGGAGPEGVTHRLATGLLGYTPDTLLDDVIDAFAAGDGSAVFGVVDRVIETGQDPRRFTEDLLRRLRDLVIVSAVPDAPATGLIDVSEDQGERLVAQAARFGRAELTRAADLVALGLTEMRGATAPRLLLELICARILLPGADHASQGVLARMDRLEKRLAISGGTPSPPPAEASPPAAEASPPAAETSPPAAETSPRRRASPPAVETSPPAAETSPPAAGLTLVDVRRLWPDIVEATKSMRRVTWIHLTQNAHVVSVDQQTLTLGFANAGARESFTAGGSPEIVRQAAIDVVGADWRVETLVDPGGGAPPASARHSAEPGLPVGSASPDTRRSDASSSDAPSHDSQPAPAEAPRAEAPEPSRSGAEQPPQTDAGPSDEPPSWAAREAITTTRPEPSDGNERAVLADEAADPDDPDADTHALGGPELLQQTLGAEIIEEIRHD